MKKFTLPNVAVLLFVAALLPPPLQAKDPFNGVITMETPTPPIGDPVYDNPLYGGASSLSIILKDMIVGSGAFSAYGSSELSIVAPSVYGYSGGISFLDVSNMISISVMGDTGNSTAVVSFPSTQFDNVTLGGYMVSRAELYQQVLDYITNSEIYKELLKKMMQESLVSISDGNPNSTTSQMADSSFRNEGFTDSLDLAGQAGMEVASEVAGRASTARFTGLGFGMNTGEFRAGGFKGYFADLAVPFKNNLSEKVGLNVTLNLNYMDLEGARIYGFGATVAFPIKLEVMSKSKRWNWRVTPLVGMTARGSKDLDSGGVVWTLAGVHTFDFRINKKLIVSMVNQVGYFDSFAAKVMNDTKYDPDVNQVMMKNGLRAVTPITKRLLGEAFIIRSDFLKDATVDDYMTYGASVSFRLTRNSNITIAGNYDYASDYKSWSFGLSSIWSF